MTPTTRKNPQKFTARLLAWHKEHNTRQMPWKGEKDPYRIWISEIILQQTRVEQGLKYYKRFIHSYPKITDLAAADEKEIFKLWEGLGYYSRCRNLIASAKFISTQKGGSFPSTYEEISNLKGVGPYTAAAISSFAFDLPFAVVDGNVYRVLSRVFGIFTPIDSTEGKKEFKLLADKLLDRNEPGEYNQAIMDFGAVICKPAPLCTQCVFRETCYAFQEDCITELPVKKKKAPVKNRWFYYLVLKYRGKMAVRQRIAKDIWQQLYEFPLVEMNGEAEPDQILSAAEKSGILPRKNYKVSSISPVVRQQLSHQLITGRFIEVDLQQAPPPGREWQWLSQEEVAELAFPRIISAYIRDVISAY